MKYLLLLLPAAAALKVNDVKPLCMKASDMAGYPVGPGGKWKVESEKKYDPMPEAFARGPNRGIQVGCTYDKFMLFEPKTCRLPSHKDDVPVKPKRVVFMGDSVMDQSAASYSWFAQKENRITDQKPCGFMKEEMNEHLEKSGLFSKETIKDTVHWMVQQGGNNNKNGHIWWGCKNSTVAFVPVLTLEPKNPEVIKALMYTVKTFHDQGPLGPEDVIVMNWGLHGLKDGKKTNLVRMDKEWTPALTLLMKEWKAWKQEGAAPKMIWREVSPQHFAGGGNWNEGIDLKQKCAAMGALNLQAKDATRFPLRNDNMFKKAVEEAGLEVDHHDIEILPVWRASAERFDEHPNGDCTHFCQYGAVNRYWNSALLSTASGMLKAAPKQKEIKAHGLKEIKPKKEEKKKEKKA